MAETHETARTLAPLKGPPPTGLDDALRHSIAEGDTGPLRAWAHARGTAAARAGAVKEALVDEILSMARTLDGRLPPAVAGDGASTGVESAMVVAAIEGYSEAGSSAPIELLRDRVAELTALHRVISAANSSLKLSDMLTETAQAVVAVTRADVCSIFLYE